MTISVAKACLWLGVLFIFEKGLWLIYLDVLLSDYNLSSPFLQSVKMLVTRSRIIFARSFDIWSFSDSGPKIARPSKKSMVFLKWTRF